MTDVLVFDQDARPRALTLDLPSDVLVFDELVGRSVWQDEGSTDFLLLDAPQASLTMATSPQDFLMLDPPNTPAVVVREEDGGELIVITTSGPKGEQGEPGPQGPMGPPGDAAGSISYTHTQIASATTWDILHPLNFRPNVRIVDSAGFTVWGDIEDVGPGHLRLHFTVPFGGTAYLS